MAQRSQSAGLMSGEALLLRLRWTLAAAQLWPADAFRLLDARLKRQLSQFNSNIFRSLFFRASTVPIGSLSDFIRKYHDY
jgi:hypothetical protein